MQFRGTGILLFTDKYQQCVDFYKKKMELPIIFSEPNFLTTFKFGSGYLMVEINGPITENKPKSLATNPTVLRFDVESQNFETTVKHLQEKGIELQLQTFDWGHTASFHDPDGNRCELYAPLANMPDNFTQR